MAGLKTTEFTTIWTDFDGLGMTNFYRTRVSVCSPAGFLPNPKFVRSLHREVTDFGSRKMAGSEERLIAKKIDGTRLAKKDEF